MNKIMTHTMLILILMIFLQVTGCVSPTQALTPTTPAALTFTPYTPPTLTPAPSTSTPFPTAALIPSQTAGTQLWVEIDKYMTALTEHGQFSGTLLVARDGVVLVNQGYGMANWELKTPNTPQTQFRIGSVSKQFTALAVLQLQQVGKLNVRDPICQYIQDCPDTWQPVTIHHLLTHTSGIQNFTGLANFTEFKLQPATPLQIIDLFRDLPLGFDPGERWSYSNSGYILLGYIIEQVSGQSYADFLQDNLFKPLHMANTAYADAGRIIALRATGYTSTGVNAGDIDLSVTYAAGGLHSTVEDLFRFDQALFTGSLIPLSLQDEIFTPFVPIPARQVGVSGASYGYGWMIGKQLGRRWVAHGGGIEGFAARFERYPDDNLTIILLSNLENAPVRVIALKIANMVFGAE